MGAVAAAAVVVSLLVAYYRERSAVMETQGRELTLFATAAAHAAANALAAEVSGTSGELDRLFAHITRDPLVRTIALLDANGRVDRRAGAHPGAVDTQVARAALTRDSATIDTDVRGRRTQVLVPVPGADGRAPARLLHIEIDITHSLQRLGHYLWFGAAAMVLLTIVLVVVLYASLRRAVVRPVQQLATQSVRLGSGDLAARSGLDANTAGSREIHQLAMAFDAMAARMQESEEALEERARERTRELELAVAELESFSYSVSHDLRSPLRSIDGFALILADRLGTALSDEGRGYIERIRLQAQYMGSLIDNLLTLAHVSRVDLDRIHLDLSALAEECIASLGRGDPNRHVDVTIHPELVAHADPELLRVAMTHLIENAWKFTRDASQPRIEIGVEARHNRAAAFVRDNGVGFDPAYVERLFTPFRRLHSPREFSGTGIGLAIVQRVIQRHGGQIWAESRPGHGATFYFTLAGA